MLSLPFYLYLGIILIFVSGIFYHPLMGIGAIEFGGGRMQMDIDYATDMSDIPKPDPYFYTNAILSASYGVLLLAIPATDTMMEEISDNYTDKTGYGFCYFTDGKLIMPCKMS